MKLRPHFKKILILAFLSYIFCMAGNGIFSLTNPDEVFYAQTAKEMAQHKTWMVPYLFGHPQFEKPIFTYWLLRMAYLLFGVTSFSARFFPALFAMIGVIAVYFLGLVGFRDEKKAFFSSLVLMSSGLYIGLARTVFTDMIFSIFILLSLVSFFWGYALQEKKMVGLLLFFIFSGLAVLTKGPLGFLLPFLTVVVFLLLKRDLKFLMSKYSCWGFLVFAAISLPWYIFIINKYGYNFTHEFFYNDHIRRIFEAEHKTNDTWYFYPLSTVGCIFPWSLFFLASLFTIPRLLKRRENRGFLIFLLSWISVVLFVFQFAHSKLVSYIFPLFPALALITGNFIYEAALLRKKVFLSISLVNVTILLLLPLGLGIFSNQFSMYLPFKNFLYCLIIVLSVLILLKLWFIRQNEYFKSTYTLGLFIPVVLFILSFAHNNIEPYISSQRACEYLLKHYSVNNTILCSKFFARGIRYHTDKDVAIIYADGKSFFSPMRVPFLDTDQKIRDLLLKQSVTLCILKKSFLDEIERVTSGKDFKVSIVRVIGNDYVVKIERV